MDRQGTSSMPQSMQAVGQRMAVATSGQHYDQVTVNDYPPGVGLAPHIDTHSAFAGRSPLTSCLLGLALITAAVP